VSLLLERVLRIGAVVGFSWILVYMSRFVFRRLLLRRLKASKRQVDLSRKLNTFLPLLQSVVTYLVVFFALVLILREIGIDATAILAGAGVVGIAVGFGAQTLIRDILTGSFFWFSRTVSQ